MKRIFRFDDICLNTDEHKLTEMIGFLEEHYDNDLEIILCISPLIHTLNNERVFPKELTAMSDHRNFYKVNDCGIPDFAFILMKENPEVIRIASHGLIHVDHRLLPHSTQELSIISSCSLLHSETFVPPFNKWNQDTEDICNENDIELVKWEDGWKSMEHNPYDPDQELWYLHSRSWTINSFSEFFNKYQKKPAPPPNEFIKDGRSRHTCKESRTCTCSVIGLEPDENCPLHGAGEWPPRCEICGRFMNRNWDFFNIVKFPNNFLGENISDAVKIFRKSFKNK